MEYAGEGGVQLSVGAEMQAYGGQGKQLLKTNKLYCKSREELGRRPCDHQHVHALMFNLTRSDRGQAITFQYTV